MNYSELERDNWEKEDIIMKNIVIAASLIAALLGTTMVNAVENKEASVGTATSKEVIDDSVITTKVKEHFIQEKLFGNKDIKAITLHVETHNGVVRLTGTVDNEAQLENAVNIAKKVEGVKKVESDVKVVAKK
jgi:hyperosmotically inducible protein